MKIAFVVERFDPMLGGVEVYARSLARTLTMRGHTVHVYTSDPGPAEEGLTVKPVPRTMLKPLRHHHFTRRAAAMTPRNEYDVVHGFGRATNVDFVQLHGGVHRVWMDQQLAAAETQAARAVVRFKHAVGLGHRLKLQIEREQFADPDVQVMAISRMTATQAMSIYGVAPERMTVIHNGTDVDRFHPRHRERYRAAMRRRLGLQDETAVLFVGHSFERKGLRSALRTLPLLKDVSPGVRLLVVGGDSPGRYLREARELGVEKMIQFVGRSRVIEEFYAAADIFVFPSWYDPFGLVALEAMAAGLPVLLSTLSGASEIVTPGREGYVVAPDDVAGLARATRALLDPDVRAVAGLAARATAEKHSSQQHADEVVAYYERIAARAPELRRRSADRQTVLGAFPQRTHGSASVAGAAISAHHACLTGGPGEILKNAPHSRLTRVMVREWPRPLVVKEFRWRTVAYRLKDVLRPSQAVREWRNIHRLKALGVSVANPVAFVEHLSWFRPAASYLVTEALMEMRRIDSTAYLELRDGARRPGWTRLLTAFANYLSVLHSRGIGHDDMKPSNILAREVDGQWVFSLVDLASVRYTSETPYRRCVLNLAQINASLMLMVTRTDRRRFLAAYLSGRKGLPPLRQVWNDVLRVTQRRHCIWRKTRPHGGPATTASPAPDHRRM